MAIYFCAGRKLRDDAEQNLGCVLPGGMSLDSVTIPDSVTSLGEGAFQDCATLKRVKMPRKLNRLVFEKYYGISRKCVRFT